MNKVLLTTLAIFTIINTTPLAAKTFAAQNTSRQVKTGQPTTSVGQSFKHKQAKSHHKKSKALNKRTAPNTATAANPTSAASFATSESIPAWAGWYVGLNAGYAFNSSKDTITPSGCYLDGSCGSGNPADNPLLTTLISLNASHSLEGVQLGYNWQGNTWVLGIEADYDYYGLKDPAAGTNILQTPYTGTLSYQVQHRVEWLSTLRARAGVFARPCTLIYVTYGLALANIESSSNVILSSSGATFSGVANTKAHWGWSGGIGAEQAWSEHWLTKLEYVYDHFSGLGYNDPNIDGIAPNASFQNSMKQAEKTLRMGISYHF